MSSADRSSLSPRAYQFCDTQTGTYLARPASPHVSTSEFTTPVGKNELKGDDVYGSVRPQCLGHMLLSLYSANLKSSWSLVWLKSTHPTSTQKLFASMESWNLKADRLDPIAAPPQSCLLSMVSFCGFMCLSKPTTVYNYILHYNLRNWYLIGTSTSETVIKPESRGSLFSMVWSLDGNSWA